MALQLLIAGNPRISYLERESLRINQDAATYVSTCYFTLIDPANVITAAVKDTIVVQDPALAPFPLIYFDGTVANVDYNPLGGGSDPKRRVKLQCQDNNILVEEAIVVGPHSYVAVADNVIIAALFALYAPGFDAATHVNIVDGAVTIDFQNITLREAMKQLCDRTGGFWFVRASDLYYGIEADFGLVPWDLSDTPDNVNSFGYLHDTSRKFHGSNMVNIITVIGVLAAAGGVTRQDAASRAIYGDHAAITTDNRISTVAGATKRGDAILADWSMPRESYTVKTFPGNRTAIAGQRIRYINSVYGINAVYTIRRLSISFPKDTALYTMALGDDLDLGLLGQRIFLDKIEEALEPIEPMDLPLSSMGWSHNLEFTPIDFDTVGWSGGTITAADGRNFLIAPPANTGNMITGPPWPRYVYLDIAVSVTALQWNDVAANAVGPNKILIAVCFPSTDVALDAVVQVMGGAGKGIGIFINAENMAANCITANEIHANAINAGHIQADAVTAIKILAGSITTPKLAAGAVTADKLSIGSMFFTDTDGMLLYGPYCEINPPTVAPWNDGTWYSPRRQRAVLTGAFHREAGRWLDTRALIVEEETTNLCINPSVEKDLATWALQSSVISRSGPSVLYARYGEYHIKVETSNAAAQEGASHSCTANTAAGTEYCFSVWARGGMGTETVRLGTFDDDVGGQWGPVVTLTQQWKRYSIVKTFGALSTSRNFVIWTNVQQNITFRIDAAQIEQQDFPTTYCDGSLGAGYAWVGAVHASTSTRTETDLRLNDHLSLVSSNGSMTFAMWVRMPYDYDAVWPSPGFNTLFSLRGANDNNRIGLRFDEGPEVFQVYINGAVRLVSSAQTFSYGDWIHLTVAFDFTADDYNLYINGVLEDNDTTALVAPGNIANWAIGSVYDGSAWHAGFHFAEYALFDSVLTAAQAAQLYNLPRPLIDAGSIDTSGIYIYDGRFRIASSTTGNRIEITADEIAGYNSAGVKQFYLQSSDGKAVAGAGAVTLDATGVTLSAVDAATSRVKWDLAGVTLAQIGGYQVGAFNYMWAQCPAPAVNTISTAIELDAKAFAGLDDVNIVMVSERAGVDGFIRLRVVGNVWFELKDGYGMIVEDFRIGQGLVVGTTTVNPSNDDLRVAGGIQVGETDIDPDTACILFQGRATHPAAPADGLYLYHYTGGGRNAFYAKWGDGVTAEIINHP